MGRMSCFVGWALAVAFSGLAMGAEPVKATPAAVAAHSLFEEYWEWVMREYPTYATFLGDHRYDDRLGDESPEAVARRKAFFPAFLRRLDQVDGKQLSADDRTSLEVLNSGEKRVASTSCLIRAVQRSRQLGAGHADGRYPSRPARARESHALHLGQGLRELHQAIGSGAVGHSPLDRTDADRAGGRLGAAEDRDCAGAAAAGSADGPDPEKSPVPPSSPCPPTLRRGSGATRVFWPAGDSRQRDSGVPVAQGVL